MTDLTTSPPVIHRVTARDVNRATAICFLAWVFATYDFVLFGNLLPELAKEFGWAEAQSTGVNTVVTIGTAIVAFALGPIIDKIGRRKGIILAVAGAALASLLTAVAGWLIGLFAGVGLVVLVLVRSLGGLGYGEQALNATYLNEMFAQTHADPSKARQRGFIFSLVQSGWPVGSILAAASVYLLFPIGGWALCFVVAVAPAFFIFLAARWLKESPQFENRRTAQLLLAEGRTLEAEAFAREAGVRINEEHAPLVAAFRGDALRATIVIGLSLFLSWFGVLTFAILGTSLLTADSGKAIDFNNALVVLVVSNAASFVGYLFFGWLGDRISRRNAIAVGWVLSAITFTAMLFAPSSEALVITLYSAGLACLIGPYSALVFFTSESFPVNARATGGTIALASGQIGAVVSGALITTSLSAGQTWINAALTWGAAPILLSAILIMFARKVEPGTVRLD